jgi:uncharacterized protein YndB with AHSA1/START domain
MTDQVNVSRDIDAPAEQVWSMITDVTRMGEWSPETTSAAWVKGATGPVPGAKFQGTNRNGKRTWKTVATVIDAEPGRSFSFRVVAAGVKIAEWRYDIEPTDTGCRVTESWTDLRPGFFKRPSGMISGVSDRPSHNRTGMEQTLSRLKAAAEA